MQISEILVGIDEEISRLQQARNLLAENGTGRVQRGLTAAAAASAFPFGINKTASEKAP